MPSDELNQIQQQIPHASPIDPVELDLESEVQFNCHPGISCFNACCKNIDITLMPYDIMRLKRRQGMTSAQWVARYTVPFPMDVHHLPGLKMATKPGTSECVFLEPSGCSVYSDRPSACRYYALGSMGVKKQSGVQVEDLYFLVKEDHCKGHDEPVTIKVKDYLEQQGLTQYDAINRQWRDIVLKKRSSGPTVGRPTDRSLQLFDMCSYDIDNFRLFLQTDGFNDVFELSATEQAELLADEDRLFLFACRFLKQVLFGEQSIKRKPGARARRLAKQAERSAAQPGTD